MVTHDKSTTVNIPGANHDKRHCPSDPGRHNVLPYKGYYMVNIQKGNGGHLVQAVERNGRYTLILGGTDPYTENSKNSEN